MKIQCRSERYEIFCNEYVLWEFSLQEKFWFDMTSSFQVRILIFSSEVRYLV